MEVNSIVLEYVVNNLEESIEFYKDILGFELLMWEKEEEEMYWAKLKKGSFELSLKQRARINEELPFMKEVVTGGTITMVLQVDNVLEAYEKVSQQCQLLNYPHLTPCGATDFSMKDPNGYFITIEQPAENS